MKTSFSTLLLLLVTVTISFCQKSLKPGYILSLENDTTRGYIDFRGDKYNSTKCIFYLSEGAVPVIYTPGEIKGYRVEESRFYISKSVKIGEAKKTVFLEYLVNGITSLYYLKDGIGEHFFIEKGSDMYELTNQVSIVKENNDQYYRESNMYKGLLTIIYSDTKEIVPSIRDSGFDRKSMMNLSEQYHNLICTDRTCIVYEKKAKSFELTWGPVVDFEWFNSKYQGLLAPYEFTETETFLAGIAANLRFLSINEKFSLGMKALFGKDCSTGTYSRVTMGGIENNIISFKNNKLLTSLHLRYEYPGSKFRPTAGLGTGLSFYFNNNTDFTKTIVDLNGDIVSEFSSENVLRQIYDISFSATLGFSYFINRKRSILFDIYYTHGRGFYRESINSIGYGREDVSRYARTSSVGIMTGFLF